MARLLSAFFVLLSLIFIALPVSSGLFDLFEPEPKFFVIDNSPTITGGFDGNAASICDGNTALTGQGICVTITGFDSGGGGVDNIGDLNDVTITNAEDEQLLVFNSSNAIWENKDLNALILRVSTGFLTSFTDSDLNADGILNILHDANTQFPTVTVYDNNDSIMLPDKVFFVDEDNIDVNLLSQTPLIGTWNLRVEGSQADVNSVFIRLDGSNDQDISAQIQFPQGVLLPNTQSLSFRDSDLNISSRVDGVITYSADINHVFDGNVVINGTLFGGSPLKVQGGIDLQTGDLTASRNVFVDSNLTYGGSYGEMHQNDGGTVIDITDVGVFVGIGDFNIGNARNVTLNDTNFSVTQEGYYLINYSVSISGVNNKAFETAIIIDAEVQAAGRAHRKLAANDTGNVGGTAILDLLVGENICIGIANLTNTDDPTIDSASFTITYIGKV